MIRIMTMQCLILTIAVVWSAAPAAASECVECHTDVERLKAITRNLPQPEASAETAGKG